LHHETEPKTAFHRDDIAYHCGGRCDRARRHCRNPCSHSKSAYGRSVYGPCAIRCRAGSQARDDQAWGRKAENRKEEQESTRSGLINSSLARLERQDTAPNNRPAARAASHLSRSSSRGRARRARGVAASCTIGPRPAVSATKSKYFPILP
jgi:hypothetical protein